MPMHRDATSSEPLFTSPKIEAEWKRFARELESVSSENRIRDYAGQVLLNHFLILDFFDSEQSGDPVGGVGPRDFNLLLSAVARQYVEYGGIQKWKDPFDQLATVFFGLVQNHAFHDANKRTALLTLLRGLDAMGRCSSVQKKDWEDLAVRVASHRLAEYPAYRDFRKRDDGEVLFLGRFFRSKTRKLEKIHYLVTYRQLEVILRRFGFKLGEPKGNYIDVIREENKKRWFFGRTEKIDQKVCQIGFPSWNAEVSRSAMKTIRRECGLTDANGIDSQVFFKGVEPAHVLIAEYAAPLRRLADR